MSDQSNSKNRFSVIAVSVMVLIAALTRLFPHPPNVTPICAMAILGAAYLNKNQLRFIIPIAALFFSDLVLNNTIYRHYYPDAEGFVFITQNTLFVYGAVLLIVLLSRLFLKKIRPVNIILASIVASLVFYIVTNFGSWMIFSFYPKTAAGLLESYIAGLPFLRNALFGDLFFSGVLFGGYALMHQYRHRFSWAQ